MKGTVIIISPIHWHFTWQNAQHLASGLAQRGYQVLFLEPLPKRWPRLDELDRVWGRIKGESVAAGTIEQPLADGVRLITPRLLPDVGRISQTINRRLFVPAIAARLRNYIDGSLIVINYLPTSAAVGLMEQLQADATFYRCASDWANDPYVSGVLYERELVQAVDMVWADSTFNNERLSAMQGNVVTLTEGVDLSLFERQRFEQAVRADSGPRRCLYFGSVTISNDLDLLRAVSHEFPLRIVGPVRVELPDFGPDTEFVGAVSHEDLPAYLEDADVLLLPYDRQSAHSATVVPAKLFECLATGKPTVVSGLTTLGDLEQLMYLTETNEGFLEAIRKSASEPDYLRATRMDCAEQNSYEQRLDEIEKYFVEVLNAKGKNEVNEPDLASNILDVNAHNVAPDPIGK